jgi:hypothetical protein
MMEHYVTVFDNSFLPQGLALHMSMERHAGSYTLWMLCVDDAVHDVLQRLDLPSVRLLRLSELEVAELKRVRPTRTIGEYCWTMTSFALRFVFEADATALRVTYLDADLWFRRNPAPIFRDFDSSRKHVLITDHAYAPEYDQSETSGQYCVQFMTFTREGGEPVRKWWQDRCIEWCYARYEDGKFGDQKYLDDWPERFPEQVHVLSDMELILAPWNATRFPYGQAVCWHFHDLRIEIGPSRKEYRVHCGAYPLPPTTIRYVYQEYLKDLHVAIATIKGAGGNIIAQRSGTLRARLKSFLRGYSGQWWRTAVGIYLPLP